MAKYIPNEELRKYRNLCKEVVSITCQLIDNLSKPTGKFIQDLIISELCYINVNHPDFS